MRKIGFVCALVLSLGAWGGVAEDASVLTIGTAGPDRYADGTAVLDGESYALVWRAAGHDFAGFRADGAVVESAYARILCCAPLAKDGRCSETTFAVDSRVLAACGSGGTFALYLLDSRRWDASGRVTAGGGTGVHGSVLVSETSSVSAFASATAAAPSAFRASALPEDVEAPQITAIRREGDTAVLTVARTSAALNYNVAGGASPETVGAQGALAERPVAGAAAPADEIELRVPCASLGDRAFFKVVRNPLEAAE